MKKKNIIAVIVLSILAIITVFPLVYTFLNAFNTGSAYGLIPKEWGIRGFYETFVRRPDYLIKFWNSLFITICIVSGQLLVSCLAGYGFSRFRFPGKNIVFYLVIILMLMPYQVTLVSNYAVLERLNLIGKEAAVILPAIFSPFGVFLLKQAFDMCPTEFCEAAKLDGAGEIRTLFSIMIPRAKAAVASLVILSFVDAWNMVEQPLVFLRNQYQYPLSVFLSRMNERTIGVVCVCGILAALPVLLLFLFFDEDLVEGISFTKI